MKLFVTTQYRENYAAWDWDGKGACPQYWKNKGGRDYFLQLGNPLDLTVVEDLVKAVVAKVEVRNDYVEEYAVDWFIESDDYLTPFEKDQLEYDGAIKYRPTEVTL